MPADLQPWLHRRPLKPWFGLAAALATGALLAALLLAVLTGWWVLGSPTANLQASTLWSALTGPTGTLRAALLAAPVLVGAMAGLRPRARLAPLEAFFVFALPWVLAVLLLLAGVFESLEGYAGYLATSYGFQALVSWALFIYAAYPPYPRSRRRPRAVK